MKKIKLLKKIFSAIAVLFFGAAAIFFEYLYLNSFKSGVLYRGRYIFTGVSAAITLALSLFAIKRFEDDEFAYRASLSAVTFCVAFLAVLYFGQKSGLWQKIRDVNSLRREIEKSGAYAVFAFLVLQILQVTVLPIPGVVAIGAGVCLFGEFMGGLYSFIGITAGSFISFFIGRTLGYKAAKFLLGKRTLDLTLEKIKGKDKAVLTAMFLLPFFPDDALCFAAGLSSMSAKYFSVTILITRIVSSFLTAYSVGGKIIPYDTWWGIAVWAVLIGFAAFLTKKVYDNGEKIQKAISDLKIKTKRKRAKTNLTKKRFY